MGDLDMKAKGQIKIYILSVFLVGGEHKGRETANVIGIQPLHLIEAIEHAVCQILIAS